MSYEWIGKIILKKSDPNRKNNVKLPHVTKNKKSLARKRIFQTSNVVFSLYFKIKAANLTPQKQSVFRSTSSFGVTKITTPVTSKIMKTWEQIFKKDSAQIGFKFFQL